MSKIVGILGGMGSMSTVEFMQKIVEKTPAVRDQDHLRLLVDNRPQIPDRTDFLLDEGPSPLPMMRESAQLLEKWGANLIAMPCNTAHAFIDQIKEVVSVPVLDMLHLLARELEERYSPQTAVGLLTTTGAVRSELFQKYLKNFRLITPGPDVQEALVMEAIYGAGGIKAGGALSTNRELLLKAAEALLPEKPAAIILGCTEIALALGEATFSLPFINPLDILADSVVQNALQVDAQ